MQVKLEKDEEEEEGGEGSALAVAPFFPHKKLVNWWLVVGDPGTKNLLGIKRVTVAQQSLTVKLEFTLPQGTHDRLSLYLLCDSYQGADRETKLPTLEVAEGEESDEEDDESSEEEGSEDGDGDAKMA